MDNSVNTDFRLLGFPADPFQTNCYIAIDDQPSAKKDSEGRQPATVIDPGHGAAELIRQAQQDHGFYVERIVLTHGHIDHVRDVAEFDVPVFIHAADRALVEQPADNQRMPELERIFDVANMKIPTEVHNLGDDVEIGGRPFRVHHMPGHSPGSVMFRVPGLVIGGDVLFNGGVGRTDLPGSNPEDMMLSLKRVASEFDDDDTVLPGHGPQTTVGQEKKTNPFLHEVQ